MGREAQGQLKSLDLILLFLTLGLTLLLPATIVQGQLLDIKIYETEHRVEREGIRLAYNSDLITAYLDGEERGVASADAPDLGLGRDAWGRSLRLQILSDSRGNATEVAVWSAGPNGAFETRMRRRASTGALRFEGDDIGYVYRLKAKPL